MGGTARRSITAATGLVLVAALAGCGSAASDRGDSSPEPSGPTHPAGPTVAPSPEPSTPSTSTPPTGTQVGGWDIRYLENGKIKVLKVEDFPG